MWTDEVGVEQNTSYSVYLTNNRLHRVSTDPPKDNNSETWDTLTAEKTIIKETQVFNKHGATLELAGGTVYSREL